LINPAANVATPNWLETSARAQKQEKAKEKVTRVNPEEVHSKGPVTSLGAWPAGSIARVCPVQSVVMRTGVEKASCETDRTTKTHGNAEAPKIEAGAGTNNTTPH